MSRCCIDRLSPLSTYTSGDFAARAAEYKVMLSVGREGECWDSAVAESFLATIKRELIDNPLLARRLHFGAPPLHTRRSRPRPSPHRHPQAA